MSADAEASKPWDRMAGETAVWFRRFSEFYLPQRTARRSLTAAVRAEWARRVPEGTSKQAPGRPRTWRVAFEKWRWMERAAAYDTEQAELAVVEWTRRQAAQREREWDTSQKLMDKALQMLQYPLARVSKDGDKTTIEPGDWSMRDAAYIAEIASKLARLALEMSQGRYTVTDKDLNDRIEHELARLSSAAAPAEADQSGI